MLGANNAKRAAPSDDTGAPRIGNIYETERRLQEDSAILPCSNSTTDLLQTLHRSVISIFAASRTNDVRYLLILVPAKPDLTRSTITRDDRIALLDKWRRSQTRSGSEPDQGKCRRARQRRAVAYPYRRPDRMRSRVARSMGTAAEATRWRRCVGECGRYGEAGVFISVNNPVICPIPEEEWGPKSSGLPVLRQKPG